MPNLISIGLLCISLASPGWASDSCDPAPGVPGQDVTLNLDHDGISRTYVLHLPAGYDCTGPYPMVVGVHGYGGSGEFFENKWAELFDHVNQNDYIGLFPDGLHPTPAHPGARAFNDLAGRNDAGPDGLTCEPPPFAYPVFGNCPANESDRTCSWGVSCADDLGFFRSLIESARDLFHVDASRIYMVGYSQGGSTVHGLAPDLQDLLAAVAPMHGYLANGFARGPEGPLPYLTVWGRNDTTVRGYEEPSSDRLIYDSPEESALAWAQSQGCSTDGTTPWPSTADGTLGWSCNEHADCASNSQVVTCAWDGEHTWPKQADNNFSWDVIWAFFQQHAKPIPAGE